MSFGRYKNVSSFERSASVSRSSKGSPSTWAGSGARIPSSSVPSRLARSSMGLFSRPGSTSPASVSVGRSRFVCRSRSCTWLPYPPRSLCGVGRRISLRRSPAPSPSFIYRSGCSRCKSPVLLEFVDEGGRTAERGDDRRAAHHQRQREELVQLLPGGRELPEADQVIGDAVLAIPHDRDRQRQKVLGLRREGALLVRQRVELGESLEHRIAALLEPARLPTQAAKASRRSPTFATPLLLGSTV